MFSTLQLFLATNRAQQLTCMGPACGTVSTFSPGTLNLTCFEGFRARCGRTFSVRTALQKGPFRVAGGTSVISARAYESRAQRQLATDQRAHAPPGPSARPP